MYKDGFTLPGLSETILFNFAQKGFKEYLKQEPDIDTSTYFYLTNIDKKIENYKEQDIKAKRPLDNYIQKDEVMELFKKQKYVCHYCWSSSTVSSTGHWIALIVAKHIHPVIVLSLV